MTRVAPVASTRRPTAGGQKHRHGERGAALVVVLLFAAMLSGLTATVLQASGSAARAASVFLDEMRADELGRAAADAVASHIFERGAAAQRGGAFAIHLAQAEIEVDYRSESARVDVNKGAPDLIAAVLAAAGADEAVVAAARARIAADRGGTAPLPPPLKSSGGFADVSMRPVGPSPFGTTPQPAPAVDDVGEIVDRWSLPREVARRVLPAFSVANGAATVDPVLADRLVLTALLGDETRVDNYIDRRTTGFVDTGSALALLPVPAQGWTGFADVSAVRALVRVTVARRFTRRYEIVLDPPAFAGQAPDILSWHPLF